MIEIDMDKKYLMYLLIPIFCKSSECRILVDSAEFFSKYSVNLPNGEVIGFIDNDNDGERSIGDTDFSIGQYVVDDQSLVLDRPWCDVW